MPRNAFCGDMRVAEHDPSSAIGEVLVLRIRKGNIVGPLQLDPYRVVVASFPPLEHRHAGMPGTLPECNVLQDFPGAPDQQMRRDAQAGDLQEIGMCLGVEAVQKKIVDPISGEVTWR